MAMNLTLDDLPGQVPYLSADPQRIDTWRQRLSGLPGPLVALVWHTHLSMRVAFKIQTLIMRLPTREVLPARGGVGFPLSKEEMRWHLNYFNIAV